MKRFTPIALAMLLFSGAASAQVGPGSGDFFEALLGEDGPLQGAMDAASQQSLNPLIDGLVSDTGLIRGQAAGPLNNAAAGLLVEQDPQRTSTGLQNALMLISGALLESAAGTDDPMALPDVLTDLFGGLGGGIPGAGMGGFLAGGMVAGGGNGLSPAETPLNALDPGTRAALSNGVTLSGL